VQPNPLWNPRCRCTCIALTALIEDGRANRENIHVTFVDLPLTDYSEAGLTVADQKRNP
jgi:phenylpyruvate tautomerase PptA (4-oxalocrotonate tautomerase family)